MRRFLATTFGWRTGALVSVLLAATLAGPAAAKNTNLTATAKYSASSEWESDKGNTTFIAAKAFDGDLTTRWNVASGDNEGSWITANWDKPVTINRVVLREFLDRVTGFRVQRRDEGSDVWQDAYVAEGDGWAAVKGGVPNNAVFSVRFSQPMQTAGLRLLFTQVAGPPTVWEVEAWNNPAGTVTGTVTDPAGKPIQGATIRAGEDRATTNAQGKYTLIADADRYNVVASKTGAFRDRIARALVLPPNGTVTHDFVLLPLPPNLSLAATAVASSEDDSGNNGAALAKDGKLNTRWMAASTETAGAYLEMQWAQAQTFNKVTVREAGDRIRNYTLQQYDEAKAAYVAIAGQQNIDVPKGSGDRTLTRIFTTPVSSKRLRFLVNVTDDVPAVNELEVANAPVATVSGVVKDVASGNAVAKAEISTDQGGVLGTSDDKGQFSVLVEPDDYVLSASAPGYFAGAPVAFTINAGESQQITLTAPARGPNIARAAKASASTEDPDHPAALVNDGDESTYWLATVYNNQWVALTWDKPTRFTVVQLRGFRGVIGRSFLEMLAADGKTWMEVPKTVFSPESFGAPFNPTIDFFFPDGITTTGLRYFITATNSTDNIPGLSEFVIFDSPIPKPAP